MSHPLPDTTQPTSKFDLDQPQQPHHHLISPSHHNHNNALQQPTADTATTNHMPHANTASTTPSINTTNSIPNTIDQRQIGLDSRLQGMYDELVHQRRDLEFERKVAEFENRMREREIKLKEGEANLKAGEANLKVGEATLKLGEANLASEKAQFQLMMDQYYLCSGNNNGWDVGMVRNSDGGTLKDGFNSLPTSNSIQDDEQQQNPLTQSDLDMVRVELSSKMDEITKKGKLIKGIIKQLDNQRDDLHRKELQFENDIKSAVDDIDARLLNVQAQEEMIEMEWDRFQTEIKHREQGLEVREELLLLMGLPPQFTKILSLLNLDLLRHPPILSLFEESDTNPIPMEKLKAIVDFKLDLENAVRVIAIPDVEFHHHYEIINQCNTNSKYYGAEETGVEIEFRSRQLSKQVHLVYEHYTDLIRLIFDTGTYKHVNPHDVSMENHSRPILISEWDSDSVSGKAPPFTPELKIFFKTPNIADNTWIQCSGPGTVLWDIDPNFKLTVGSLCDPNRKGKFKSINLQDEETDPDREFNGKPETSHYRISFKWE